MSPSFQWVEEGWENLHGVSTARTGPIIITLKLPQGFFSFSWATSNLLPVKKPAGRSHLSRNLVSRGRFLEVSTPKDTKELVRKHPFNLQSFPWKGQTAPPKLDEIEWNPWKCKKSRYNKMGMLFCFCKGLDLEDKFMNKQNTQVKAFEKWDLCLKAWKSQHFL